MIVVVFVSRLRISLNRMNRFVNILMIIVLVTCPFRCMVLGCGCYASPELAQASADMGSCCCGGKAADPREQDDLPEKCCGKCFCSGVTTVDCFEVSCEPSSQPFSCPPLLIEINVSNPRLRQLVLLGKPVTPPCSFAANQGREIRCLISSLVI